MNKKGKTFSPFIYFGPVINHKSFKIKREKILGVHTSALLYSISNFLDEEN